jgi:hypothetical protein
VTVAEVDTVAPPYVAVTPTAPVAVAARLDEVKVAVFAEGTRVPIDRLPSDHK